MTKKTYAPVLADDVANAIGTTTIVDVRPESYFVQGRIPTSINVAFDVIASKDGELADNIVAAFTDAGIKPEDEFIVTCQTGYHSKLAADALFDAGFENVLYYPGSFEDWELDSSHPVEK